MVRGSDWSPSIKFTFDGMHAAHVVHVLSEIAWDSENTSVSPARVKVASLENPQQTGNHPPIIGITCCCTKHFGCIL